jgi:hypothetical protein
MAAERLSGRMLLQVHDEHAERSPRGWRIIRAGRVTPVERVWNELGLD